MQVAVYKERPYWNKQIEAVKESAYSALLSLRQQPYASRKRSASSHIESSRMRARKPGLLTPVTDGKVISLPSAVHNLARAWLELKGVCLVNKNWGDDKSGKKSGL